EYGPPDAPAVVLVHGWLCTAKIWTRQIQALRTDHRLLAYDMRGHGRSSLVRDGVFSIEALADDLEDVVHDCIRGERRFVLAGHSLGALTIVAWAARHPASAERVAAAALINVGGGELLGRSAVARLPLQLASPLSRRLLRHLVLDAQASPATVDFCEGMLV